MRFPAAAVVVGGVFVVTGMVRPPFLWDMGKVAGGRALVGDTATSAFFVVFGIVLPVVAIAISMKRNVK